MINGWVGRLFMMQWRSETRRVRWVFFGFVALLSGVFASPASAALPELPRVFLDTTYSPPTGNTITVNAGGNLQTAINNAQPGDTIVLQAGATFTGTFTLPNKGTSTQWIYIRSSAYLSLPAPGNRVYPGQRFQHGHHCGHRRSGDCHPDP